MVDDARYLVDAYNNDERQELITTIASLLSGHIDIAAKIADYVDSRIYIFDSLTPTVLTAQGLLSNVQFEEEDLIFYIKATGRIKRITCNFGEINSADYIEPPQKLRNTKRGRKRKVKKRTVRKNQGNGKYFNSQLTGWVVSDNPMRPDKYYKVKVFRNGVTEIPGGLRPDMLDVEGAVQVMAEGLSNCLDADVRILELYSIMRNYKFGTLDSGTRINVERLYRIFIREHEQKSENLVDVTEIKYNIERYPGLIVKFATPITRNREKQTTIKMFQSGKVNIDGAVSESCALFYYRWINDFYVRHRDEVVFSPLLDNEDLDSDSDSINMGVRDCDDEAVVNKGLSFSDSDMSEH